MKKFLFSLQLLTIAMFLTARLGAQNQYKTIAAGNWSAAGTWSSVAPYDGVPPNSIPNNHVVEILHKVIYNLANDMEIQGSLYIANDTLRFPNNGTAGTGRSIFVKSTGFLSVSNGGIVMPIQTTAGSNNNGNIINQGGHCVYFKSYCEVAQNWESESNGKRKFINSCLKLGENYANKNSTDTLQNVCIELGLHGSGNFENDGGTIRANITTVLLKGSSGNFANKSASSEILTYLSPTYAFQAINVPGNMENVGTWVAPINKYCVVGSISGSQAAAIDFTSPEDCPWFVANNSCIDCRPNNIPLPVDFKSFTASRSYNNVLLKWETASERNNSGFAIERNINGNWQEIAWVPTLAHNGNSDITIAYSHSDLNYTKGISQYRIRQVDFDAKTKYSDVRSVRGDGQKSKVIVYPNPTNNGKVNVVFEDATATRDIAVSDMSGRVVRQVRGVTNNNITIENLQPGMYTIKIVVLETGEQVVEKIVVNK